MGGSVLFQVSYRGRDADDNILEAEAYARSVLGASKLYTSVMHYIAIGRVHKGRQRKSFQAYASPTTPGSVDQEWVILPLGEYVRNPKLYNDFVSLIFRQVLSAVMGQVTRRGSRTEELEKLASILHDKERTTRRLAAGLVRANDNLTDINKRLIDSIPYLSESVAPHLREFVEPVGRSCAEIIQFSKRRDERLILDIPDAEVIRRKVTRMTDWQMYRILRVSKINTRTGHCIVDVEGLRSGVSAYIMNISNLSRPNNYYTQAMNLHSILWVEARAAIREGRVVKLYIRKVVKV